MLTRILLLLANAALINIGFLAAFSIKFSGKIPEYNFSSFRGSFIFLTLINILSLVFLKVYKKRFKSTWELFRRIFLGLFFGLLFSIIFIYVFRSRWFSFPTSIFMISFLVNIILIFGFNGVILKVSRKIQARVIVVGGNRDDGLLGKNSYVLPRENLDGIEQDLTGADIDEIIISSRIKDEKGLNFLMFLLQKLNINLVFSPTVYQELMQERVTGRNSVNFLNTFLGRKSESEEFLIRVLDIIGSIFILVFSLPLMAAVALLVKFSSPGQVLFKQTRVGKDGKIFTLYKFRTMVKDAEKDTGPVWASADDPRVTAAGRFLRRTRLDELPQFFNVLAGDMSLVGPRPERPHFVKLHHALQGIRLAVKPGITGFAQVRNFYDLKPEHKIKYDYLYIQKRSLLTNLYILTQTIPAMFAKKGW